MKKTAVFLSIVLGVMAICTGVTKVFAQEASPEVLAVKTIRKVTPLPKIVSGQDVVFTENVNQDLVVVGGNLDVKSRVSGNVISAGGQVKVEGVIDGNLIVAGGQVTLSGEVKGNVVTAGGSIITTETSHVGGYLLVAGGKTEMDGKVDGDTRVFTGDVMVSDKGSFGGTLLVDAGKIAVSDKATVLGEKKLTEIKSNAKMPWGYWNNLTPNSAGKNVIARVMSVFKIVELIGKVLLMLVLIKVWGKHLAELTKYVGAKFWSTLGWGFAKLFLTPILIIVLLITVFGIPLAMLVMGLYMASMFLSGYLASAILGHFLVMKGWIKNNNLYLQGVIGLLLLEIIGWVPVIGWVIKFVATLIGLGLIVRWEKRLVGMEE